MLLLRKRITNSLRECRRKREIILNYLLDNEFLLIFVVSLERISHRALLYLLVNPRSISLPYTHVNTLNVDLYIYLRDGSGVFSTF